MQVLLFIAILMGFAPSWAISNSTCVELFSIYANRADELLAQNKLQEAAWELEAQGREDLAVQLTQEILTELSKANDLPYTPKKWTKLGSDKPDPVTGQAGHNNTTYLITAGRVQGVLKFGRTTAIIEPLAMKLGRILKVKVPASVAVKIGGRIASLQYYLRDLPTAEAAGDIMFSYKTEFFDYLLLEPDRNSGNFLISKNNEQILIDNEYLLNSEITFLHTNLTPIQTNQRGLTPFLQNKLKLLLKEDPVFAAHLYDVKTMKRVLEVIDSSTLKDKANIHDWILNFFGTYRNYYRSLKNIPNPNDSVG